MKKDDYATVREALKRNAQTEALDALDRIEAKAADLQAMFERYVVRYGTAVIDDALNE